ncbi:uncharacterized protein N0V89_012010 [Didymosphaeria variabile]|uniref:Uncharacterized protein n=1 Tax=Didymosphaeria variabile TaxID=1932322 RepID=A0A9W9C6A3_9PLEO|nr:uncharacterized protein N0V89_012010 [Didymosphaeria variabile]KAJ4345874.1 hypothetical protein N0V89_012010 [Didymosphaeria variabile]
MTASAHNDYVSYQGLTNHTRQLIADTISYLNGLLDKDDVRSRNSAVCTILHLTAVAMLCGEYSAAFTHLYGMFEILRLYKAQQTSCDVSRTTCHYIYDVLKFKIERLAFCLYNITGRIGPFFTEPPSWDPLDSNLCLPYEALTGLPKLDSLFCDFRALCHEVYQKSASRKKVEARYFRNAMHSLQARVLALSPGEGTPFAECLRLAITAAITSQTQLPMRRLEHPYLDAQFRRYLPLLECPADQQKRNVVLWIVMAAFIVAFDPEEETIPWAEALFRAAAGDTDDWEAARLRVASVTWFPRYIDVQNEKVFKALRKRWPVQETRPLQQSHPGKDIVLPLHIVQELSEDIGRFV